MAFFSAVVLSTLFAILPLRTLGAQAPSSATSPVQKGASADTPRVGGDSGAKAKGGKGSKTAPDTAAKTITPIDPPVAVMTGLGIIGLVFLGLFVFETRTRESIGVESHWGGFGGGLGGWHVSPALLYFVGAILFGVMLTIVAARLPTSSSTKDGQQPPPDSSARSATKGG